MTAFYVGQRVRIVRAKDRDCQHYVGQECVIRTPLEECFRKRWYGTERWFGHGVSIGDGRFYPRNDSLEPIAPPNAAGSWEAIEKLLPNIREQVTP